MFVKAKFCDGTIHKVHPQFPLNFSTIFSALVRIFHYIHVWWSLFSRLPLTISCGLRPKCGHDDQLERSFDYLTNPESIFRRACVTYLIICYRSVLIPNRGGLRFSNPLANMWTAPTFFSLEPIWIKIIFKTWVYGTRNESSSYRQSLRP